MQTELLKGIALIIIICILFYIAWNQEEMISVLEEDKSKLNFNSEAIKQIAFRITKLEEKTPSFSSKLNSEEKRMKKVVQKGKRVK